jgi:hypothetical protein
MTLTTDDRADLEAALFDLNTISRTLSELMISNVDKQGSWKGGD